MLSFKKEQESIEKFDGWQHLKIRNLKPDKDLTNIQDFMIIDDLIKSKFHHWRGEEEPNGLTVGMSSSGKDKIKKVWTLQNHKFYGFFDNSKISHKDYKPISFETFKTLLGNKIEEWNDGNKEELIKAIKIIDEMISPSSFIYSLDLDENKNKDKVAEFHVYSVFIGFIAIDKTNQKIYLIEFGQD